MTSLTPTEYKYLIRPFWSDGDDMIKTTLQELCLKNILSIEERWVFVDKRETKKRKRHFMKLGANYKSTESYNLAESVMLYPFFGKTELSFAQIRNYVKFHFSKDSDLFKNKYVLPDLKKKGFFIFPNILSSAARNERNKLKAKLENINTNIDLLIRTNTLGNELESIGLNIILLEKETINKIKDFNNEILQIGLLSFLKQNYSFDNFNSLIAISSTSFDSINSFDFSDSSVDFGGGDFGGAGGGDGDW